MYFWGHLCIFGIAAGLGTCQACVYQPGSHSIPCVKEITLQILPNSANIPLTGLSSHPLLWFCFWDKLSRCSPNPQRDDLWLFGVQFPLALVEKTKKEGKRVVCEFEQLQRFLKEKERFLLVQLADLDRAIAKVQEDAVTKVLEEMSHLDTLIWEMEGKFQQPDSKFLLDIRRLLNSCEVMKFSPPAEISPTLERRLEDFLHKNVLVKCTLRKCQDSLMFQLQEPANITMDPTTTHPNLHLSEDRKQARGQLMPQELPENPERFSFEPCVLGCQGFTSGRHFWEVEVGQGGVWALGVARASMKRKGPMSFSPKEGVWALEAYHSLTSPRANLRLNALPRRIRVSLDYEGGRVAFFSSDDDTPILVYTRASFNGEKVLPWFKIGMGARLQEITQNSPSEEQPTSGQLMSHLDWVGFRSPLKICS
ncbi:tripartite motif-containing protein 15-like isoform X2 [Lagopus leucura]|uniref:tripartite motif-containing protein 15-like isoform X2 n=1 Tax=Lagopus leucura TaxID=30410 RepID=UPI001C66E5C2|nr:tripartite motif-containing protein 15-like isoform X2 [Lagopus leucura]